MCMLREGNTEHKMLVIQAVNVEEVTVSMDMEVYPIICLLKVSWWYHHHIYFFHTTLCPLQLHDRGLLIRKAKETTN